MPFYIYKTTFIPTQQIYVGYHKSDDIDNDTYLGSGNAIRALMKTNEAKSFKREILATFETEAEATAVEEILVDWRFVHRPDTLNKVPGGRGGASVAACVSKESRKEAGRKAGIAMKGRTKETHAYLKTASEKLRSNFASMTEEQLAEHADKCLAWQQDEQKKVAAVITTAKKNKGKTKDNCDGKKRQAEKLSEHMNTWMGEHIAKQRRGKTKENDEGRRQQANKISGELSPSKRPEVKAKLTVALSGDKNPMFGLYGEASPTSKLTNAQRLTIIEEFENGATRTQLYRKYEHIVKSVTIKKLIANRELVKQQLRSAI
jgi:hypothetical protein